MLAPFSVALWERIDGDFRLADVNDAFADYAGKTREELIGLSIAELGGNVARGTRNMTRAANGETVHTEIPYVTEGGQLQQWDVVYIPDEAGYILCFSHNVTMQRDTEHRLRVTEDRYRALVAAANEGVWLVEPGGRTTFANARVGQILGRSLSEIAAAGPLDFVVERDRAHVAGALAAPRDTPAAFEARFRHSDGHELLCLFSVSPMPMDGSLPGTLCVLADMTALQRERELRHETEQRFRRMVETATEGVWTGDPAGRTTFVNAAGARMLGLDPGDVLGRNFTEFVVYDDEAAAVHEQLKRGVSAVRGNLRLQRDDGKRLDVIISASVLRDDDGEIVGSLAMITDVTRLKREQVDLRESRERFAQVFEEAPLGMVFLAAGRLVRGQFLGANREFNELLGYSETEILEQDIFSVTHPDDVEIERSLVNSMFEQHTNEYVLDKRFIRADGSEVWTRFRACVLRDENDAPLYGLGLAVDISAEKTALRTADEAVVRAHALFDSTPDAVIELDGEGSIVELNAGALLMFGVEYGATVGMRLVDMFVPERLRPRVTKALNDWFHVARDGGEIELTETMMMRGDGSEFPAALTITPIEAVGDGCLMLYVRNLGLQDRAEAARREADERFRRLFQDGPLPVALIDVRGRLTDASPAFCKLAGRGAAEMLGRDAADILGADAGDAHEAPWLAGTDGPGPLTATRRLTRPDGRSVSVTVTASLIRDASGVPTQWICQCAPQTLGSQVEARDGEPLSYRERQVLGLLARGLDGPAIAERLNLSPETVRSYATTAREKTGAKTRTEAVALALVRGEISL